MSNTQEKLIAGKGELLIDIMNREGHTTRIIIYAEAEDVVREEMASGKWANVFSKKGGSQVYTQFDKLKADILDSRGALADTEKLQLITALTGGGTK